MDTRPRIPPDTGESDTGTSDAELETLVKGLRSDLGGVRDGIRRTLLVEWQRLRARAVDACFRAAFGLCLLAFGLAASVAGALLIAGGLYKAIVLWTRVEWIGGLGAGLGILAIAVGFGVAVRNHLRNESLDRAKRALGRSVRP